MQYVEDLSTHHSPIACESQNIWTLFEHLHLLEIYYYIFLYKHFPKDKMFLVYTLAQTTFR